MDQSENTQNQSVEDVSFIHEDDTIINKQDDVDLSKYTTIDHLDEDTPIHNQQYVLLSFISPEGIMNCTQRGVKIRGVYATRSEADAASAKLKKKDKYFDIFVGEVGKWLPWDSMKHAEEVKYQNKKLDKIMSKLHEKETNTLNELVGRRKEIIDKEAVSHKNRIRNSIKDSVENFNENTTTDTDTNTQPQKITKKNHNADAVKERLQKTLSERKKKQEQQSTERVSGNVTNTNIESQKQQLNDESKRLAEKRQNVNEIKQKSTEIDENLKRMKEQLELKKKQNAELSAQVKNE